MSWDITETYGAWVDGQSEDALAVPRGSPIVLELRPPLLNGPPFVRELAGAAANPTTAPALVVTVDEDCR